MTPEENNNKPKILDQARTTLRANHYSRKTEEVYIGWIKRYIFFNNKKHLAEMGAEEIKKFISFLANERQVFIHVMNKFNGVRSSLDSIL